MGHREIFIIFCLLGAPLYIILQVEDDLRDIFLGVMNSFEVVEHVVEILSLPGGIALQKF